MSIGSSEERMPPVLDVAELPDLHTACQERPAPVDTGTSLLNLFRGSRRHGRTWAAINKTRESFLTISTRESGSRPSTASPRKTVPKARPSTASPLKDAPRMETSAASPVRTSFIPDVLREGPLPEERQLHTVGKHVIRTEPDGSWINQENKLPPRGAKILSMKKNSRLYQDVTNDEKVRRAAKAVFGIVIIFVPDIVDEIPADWTIEDWVRVRQNMAHYRFAGTAMYVGQGLLLTNAHILEWPAQAKDTPLITYEPRIYACHGSGILDKIPHNRSRARAIRYSPYFDNSRNQKRRGNLLFPEATNLPGASSNDWALLTIEDRSFWPKEKYALLPAQFRGPSPCTFVGVNQHSDDDPAARAQYMKDAKLLRKYKNCLLKLLPGQISTTTGIAHDAEEQNLVLHDISTLPGSSGSPLLTDQGKYLGLIAIHSGSGDVYTKGGMNQALSLKSDQLCRAVSEELSKSGATNGSIRSWAEFKP